MRGKPDTPGETCGCIFHWILEKVKAGRGEKSQREKQRLGDGGGEMVERLEAITPYLPSTLHFSSLAVCEPPTSTQASTWVKNALNTSLATILLQ